MAAVTTIEGIGPAFEEKLAKADINSVEALLEKGATSQGRKKIEEASGIDHSRIARFVNHADLMRIKGIGGEYAEILEAAGVDTVPELGQRNAANLAAKLAEVNEEKKLVRSVPTEGTLDGWIAQAKELPRVVGH